MDVGISKSGTKKRVKKISNNDKTDREENGTADENTQLLHIC